jgi:4-diphosphocytidyl-2-C-methyl-D-erythritol kinase
MTVRVRSFAKINLGLRIGPTRPDGFHELLTIYQTIALHDIVGVKVSRGTGIEIRCADPRVPTDESNTCFQIIERAMSALKTKGRVVIEIEKRLPVQGGLGGASANAVASLIALEKALRTTLPEQERFRIAAEVGSDLPLFLIGGTVLGIGRGERVFPLPDLPPTACVVLTPEVGVSTPKAFAAWDRISGSLGGAGNPRYGEQRSSGEPKTAPAPAGQKLTVSGTSDRMNELSRRFSAGLSELYSSAPSGLEGRGRAGNPLLWLVRAGIENDFEQVVFPEYPELCEGKQALVRAGAKYVSLSGSGSTLYGLFASREAASRAARRLRKQGWAAQVTSTLRRQQYWQRVIAE